MHKIEYSIKIINKITVKEDKSFKKIIKKH
jgi:hypothetical protein